MIVFLLLLIGGILGFALSPQFSRHIKKDLSPKLIESYFIDADRRALMDFTQEKVTVLFYILGTFFKFIATFVVDFLNLLHDSCRTVPC